MKVAIYGRLLKNEDTPYIQELFDKLHEQGISFLVHENFYPHIINKIKLIDEVVTFNDHSDICRDVDFVFSLGGDGTLLDTLTFVKNSDIPIMGVNIGRLGFLSSIGKTKIIKAIQALQKGTYVADKRTLVHLDSNVELFNDTPFGLNEFTIHKKDASSMIVIHAYVNGEFMNSYWADGIIVSTPTGSTGYSLSCGGPIIFPTSGNFVITPVSPHNLNVRPIVVSDNSVISFEVEGRSDNFLVTLDSRVEVIDKECQLAVRKEDFTVSLIRLDEINFLTTLRSKLKLGLDSRN